MPLLPVPQVGQDITPVPVVGDGVMTIGEDAVRLTLLLLPPAREKTPF